MKKILYLLIIFISLSVKGQIELTPLEICDTNNDGFGVFDLTLKTDEILNGNNPDNYTIIYFETVEDAELQVNPIANPTAYFNLFLDQTIYYNLVDNITGNLTIGYFDLIAHTLEISSPENLTSFDGFFNLTVNNSIIGDNINYTVTYHSNTYNLNNNIAIANPSNYFSTTGGTIYMRIEDEGGCYVTTGFLITKINGTISFPSTKTVYVCTNQHHIPFQVDINDYIPQILGTLNPDEYTITFHASQQDAINNTNILTNTVFSSTELSAKIVRVVNISDDSLWAFALVHFYQNQYVFSSNIPQYIRYQEDYTGLAEFDLQSWSVWDNITHNNTVLQFYLTEEDAINETNAILNPSNFENTANPQTIYISARNTFTNYCDPFITSMQLKVEQLDDDILYIPDTNFKNKLITLGHDLNNDGDIQISEALSVFYLNVSNSNIQDMTGIEAFSNLIFLGCSNNQITELNVSNLINITSLNCQSNNITELDLSNNFYLEYISVYANNELQYLNIKNGSSLSSNIDEGSWSEIWGNLPSNTYICADEFEIDSIEPYLNIWEDSNQVISSYCTFYPQGNYNTIAGTTYFDFNNDGVCDDIILQSFIKLNITDGVDQNNSFTSQDGTYIFFTQEGEYILSADVENPTFFNVTPITETVVFPDNNNNEEIVNFCISPNGEYNDLEVVIAPLTPARPGFEATYKIVYRNKGNQIMSDGLNFFFNQNLMTFVSASVEPDSQGSGSLNWSYENLMPFESRSIIVIMQINPPTHPTYPVNIDDVLTFTSLISPSDGDENTEDNLYVLNQTVVGSYDPNDITCIEGDVLDPDYIGEELHYVIRFENTGTFYAENIVVAMKIDEELYDISSLRVLDASHDVRAQVRGNVAEFFFNQIYLDSGGHGNILLVMKSMTALEEGDAVQSKADIYFDYNYPIITNDAVTIFEATMSIDENIKNIDLKVYPNPTTDYFNLISESKIQSIELYDISGRLIKTSLINDFETKQDITNLNKGTYILKIKTEKGEITGKIIKN